MLEVPTCKIPVRIDFTGNLLDFAMIEVEGTFYRIIAINGDYIIFNQVSANKKKRTFYEIVTSYDATNLQVFINHLKSLNVPVALTLNNSVSYNTIKQTFYHRYITVKL